MLEKKPALTITKIIVLSFITLGLSGCANAVIGLGTAAVAASSTEKGLSTSVADAQIYAKLKDKFIKASTSLLTSVEISVNDGAVLMTGKVQTHDKKALATKLVWEIRGVREVINELQISDKLNIKDMAKDLAASASLRTKLIADKRVSSLNFDIDIVNGIVYLSGIASNAAERSIVVAHAREVNFTQQVVDYIVLQTDKRL
ncbi:BON domain-containing protein [Candidatus Puniceispirillum sp.]|nr:BON domain-containing protein [Candidatus Puniceispirillum sp.]